MDIWIVCFSGSPMPKNGQERNAEPPRCERAACWAVFGTWVICPGSVHNQQPLPRLDAWRQCTAGLALEDTRGGSSRAWVLECGEGRREGTAHSFKAAAGMSMWV